MPRNARTTEKRLQDRQKIAEMYLRGTPQGEIAEVLKISQQQVSYDLIAIQRAWRESAIRDFDDIRAQELAKLDAIEREYWEGWIKSKAEAERTFTQITKSDKHGDSSKTQLTREKQVGDPRFLDGVLKCIAKRAELLGLDAPRRQELTGPGGGPIETTTSITQFDEVVQALRRIDHEAKAGTDGATNADGGAAG